MRKLILIMLLVAMSCAAPRPLQVSSTGTVVETTFTSVYVVYTTRIREQGDKIGLIHHFPQGHSYRVGDTYPKSHTR